MLEYVFLLLVFFVTHEMAYLDGFLRIKQFPAKYFNLLTVAAIVGLLKLVVFVISEYL